LDMPRAHACLHITIELGVAVVVNFVLLAMTLRVTIPLPTRASAAPTLVRNMAVPL